MTNYDIKTEIRHGIFVQPDNFLQRKITQNITNIMLIQINWMSIIGNMFYLGHFKVHKAIHT